LAAEFALGADEFVTRFSERIETLAASHDLLVKSRWQGIEIFDLVQAAGPRDREGGDCLIAAVVP
jgi:two-component sensor histidine kinase